MRSTDTQQVVTWPAPDGIAPSPDYELKVNGLDLFVWPARVREEIDTPPDSIWTHKPGCPSDMAGFAVFDFEGSVEVAIKPLREFASASVHPLSAGIQASIEDGVVRFRMDRPRPLTVMLDGSDDRPLHLFASAPEQDIPAADDPDVVYFGPGVHEVDGIELRSGQTLYLAGGALVRAKVPDTAKWSRAERIGCMVCDSGPVVHVNRLENVCIRGRGILDGELIPHPARQLIVVSDSRNVRIEGVVLRNSANWNIMLKDCSDVVVQNVRIVSGRLNSDGINSVNAQNITIRNCFVRNHDDSFAVKATSPEREASGIRVEGCTVWNDWGYALGVTYETRAPIHDIVFSDCDIIFVRHWALGIYVVDSATVENVRFENIRVEDLGLPARRFGSETIFIRLMVSSDMWGTDDTRGRIRNIVFENVSLGGNYPAKSEILGFDAEHGVERVRLSKINYLGRKVTSPADMNLTMNEFTSGVEFR